MAQLYTQNVLSQGTNHETHQIGAEAFQNQSGHREEKNQVLLPGIKP